MNLIIHPSYLKNPFLRENGHVAFLDKPETRYVKTNLNLLLVFKQSVYKRWQKHVTKESIEMIGRK